MAHYKLKPYSIVRVSYSYNGGKQLQQTAMGIMTCLSFSSSYVSIKQKTSFKTSSSVVTCRSYSIHNHKE